MGWQRGWVAFLHDGVMVHTSGLPLPSGNTPPHTAQGSVFIFGWFWGFFGGGEYLKTMKLALASVDFLSIANVLFPIICRRLLGG